MGIVQRVREVSIEQLPFLATLLRIIRKREDSKQGRTFNAEPMMLHNVIKAFFSLIAMLSCRDQRIR